MSFDGGNSESAAPPSPTPNLTARTPNAQQRLNHSLSAQTVESRTLEVRQETQNTLRQASVALEAAYQRITQLRNNINHLLNRMPPAFAELQSPASDSSIGPPHSALVLTDGSASETDPELLRRTSRLRELVPSSARQRLEDFEMSSRRRLENTRDVSTQGSRLRSQRWDASSDPPSQTMPSRTRSPPLPDIPVPPRRTWMALRTHSSNPDDPTTMIGRRVAARTTARSPENQSSSLPQLEQRLHSRATEIARDLENMTNRLVTHRARRVQITQRTSLDNTLSAGGGAVSSRDSGLRHRTTQLEYDADTDALPSSDDTLPPLLTISGRTPPSFNPTHEFERGQASDDVPEQEIVLSSYDRLLRRARAFPAPSSTQPAPRDEDGTYTINRRLEEDEEGRLHNIGLSEGEGSDSSREPRLLDIPIDAQERVGAFQASRLHRRRPAMWAPRPATMNVVLPADEQSTGSTRRRRGWARINADGDEIPSDEEEEIERTRARSRMRLSHPDGRSSEETFVPYTRTSIPHSSEYEPSVARVHINPQQTSSALYFFTPPEMSIIIKEESISLHADLPPRYPLDPLPTPLSQMMPSPAALNHSPPRIIAVPKHASLAGR
ncbi:hypothetical protein BV22DRAFT_1125810 [Leucogyrophana mollusca]|uniref:Uncharacterized protein n=1 Tax=Leucogyrophana mollusca TaxID=85980 RepID=A0ACB8BUI4_9AGAM|nr:hypothetical protein BV22DRAFT_1125810 [Leucogyrophana mollusca]